MHSVRSGLLAGRRNRVQVQTIGDVLELLDFVAY